jgi:hypothetical protein
MTHQESIMTILPSVTDITDSQIRALRSEARAAGDFVRFVICSVALGERNELDGDASELGADGRPDYSGGGHSRSELEQISTWLDATQEDAWAECARVIAAAQG